MSVIIAIFRYQQGRFKPSMVKCEIVTGGGRPKCGFNPLRYAAASLLIEQSWPSKNIQIENVDQRHRNS